MARTREQSRQWMQLGAELVTTAIANFDEQDFDVQSQLPGWTRKHLIAHLAANGDAIGNLVHWAATGEVTPMYPSPEARAADIEIGSRKSGSELGLWFSESAARLDEGMSALTAEQWTHEIVTAQGRTVPASETPWMRSREVMIHAVDLDSGVGFDDLPEEFLRALCDDIVTKRASADGPTAIVLVSDTADQWTIPGPGDPVQVTGSLAAITAYLAGRQFSGLTTSGNDEVPELSAWL
jgi:maleylpyruvate isomerase